MNAELLLAHFNRISDAPDAVPRLRKFVLDLAVRGRVVDQNPSDASGLKLLANLRSLKIQMLKNLGLSREQKVEYPSSDIEATIPPSWTWAHIDDVAIVQGGKRLPNGATFSKEVTDHIYIRVTDMKNGTIVTDDLRYITPEVQLSIARYTISQCDLYITIAGTIGQVGRVPSFFDGHNLTENAAKIVFRGMDADFFCLALGSDIVQEQFKDKTKQMAQPKLALKRILGAKFPLPPLAEQHRIVAKVDELMALCDGLEAAQREQNARQDQLTASTHHHLNNGGDADELRNHVQFFIGNLPRLTTRPDQIKQLRQTILNLAVRGKLVLQNPIDGGAEAIITSVKKAREKLIANRRIKPVGALAITGDEVRFDFSVPSSWLFCFVDDFALKVTDGEHATPERSQSGHYLLSARNVTNSGIDLRDVDFVPKAEFERIRNRCDPDKNDVLISCSGSVGRVAVVDQDNAYSMVRSAALIKLDSSLIDSNYVACALRSDPAQEQIQLYSKSTAQANLFIGAIRKLRIPIPPLAEQHRIVAKVDELMTLCEQLEASITTAQSETSRLLESVLHHALQNPALT